MAYEHRRRKPRNQWAVKWRYQIAFTIVLLISSITFGYEVVKMATAPATPLQLGIDPAPIDKPLTVSQSSAKSAADTVTPYIAPAAPAAIPEPSSLLLLSLAAPTLLRRRR